MSRDERSCNLLKKREVETMLLRPEILDEILKDYKNPEDLMGQGGILKQLTKALIEGCLSAELDTHLEEEGEKLAEVTENDSKARNRRNGHSKKTIKGEFGKAEIAVPRDRNGEFRLRVAMERKRTLRL